MRTAAGESGCQLGEDGDTFGRKNFDPMTPNQGSQEIACLRMRLPKRSPLEVGGWPWVIAATLLRSPSSDVVTAIVTNVRARIRIRLIWQHHWSVTSNTCQATCNTSLRFQMG